MPDTIDRQLEHLAELHAEGVLTDDEFAAAKADTLGSSTSRPTADPILAAPRPNIPSKIVWLLLVLGALVIGIAITGLSAGFEWSAAQAPAAPIVCPGGKLVVAYDVSYTVAAKGVDFASVCVKNGTAHAVSGLWLSTVMTLEYTVAFLAIFVIWRLLWLRKEARHASVATWSATGARGSGAHDG